VAWSAKNEKRAGVNGDLLPRGAISGSDAGAATLSLDKHWDSSRKDVFLSFEDVLKYPVEKWLWLTGFPGFNLLQFSITRFCPLEKILERLGIDERHARD